MMSCKQPDITAEATKPLGTQEDSIALTTLVRNLYKWHEQNPDKVGFNLKFNSPTDSIFTGIDWQAYNKDSRAWKETGFFSNIFLKMHRSITLSLDSSIHQASAEWRNINDGIPYWDTNADDWCGCQDSPDNYWKLITIKKFTKRIDTARFSWTWDTIDLPHPFLYEMQAIKENGFWKISYMEGFKYYRTVADYEKIIKPNK